MGKVLVLASGSGSNFEAIVRAFTSTPHVVVGLVCDRADALALQRAARLGVPAETISYARGKPAAEQALAEIIARSAPDLIALAGFMRILSAEFVAAYPNRIINIHPSLLPRHRGLRAIERAYESGDARLGITIHVVDAGVDTGPIIEQHHVVRDPEWSLEDAETAVHRLEHEAYARVLQTLLEQRTETERGATA